MTYINVDSVKQQDGQAYTKFQGTASQTSQTYVYKSAQDNMSITNLGFYDITVVVGGASTVISQNRSALFANVSQFSITVTQGKQDFMAESWVVNGTYDSSYRNNNFVKSLINMSGVVDVSGQGIYPLSATDNGPGFVSGFMTDQISLFSTSFDPTTTDITITHTSGLTSGIASANEFFINNDDLGQVRNSGGISFSCGIETQMTLTSLVLEFYSMTDSTYTLLDSRTIVNNPVANKVYGVNATYPASLIPGGANGLRIYIKVNGYTAGNKVTKIHNYLINYVNGGFYDTQKNKARASNDLLVALGFTRNNWRNKKWNAVGDSITSQNKWQPYVIASLGLTHNNYGVASTTIAVNNGGVAGQSFAERIPGLPDADLWTIFGGTNDWYYNTPIGAIGDSPSTSKNTFYGGLKFCIENILGRPNNQKIILFTPLQSNRNGVNTGTPTQVMLDFVNAVKAVGQYYSIPVLDLYAVGGINPINLVSLTTDSVHPNELGGSIMAPKVIQSLINL